MVILRIPDRKKVHEGIGRVHIRNLILESDTIVNNER